LSLDVAVHAHVKTRIFDRHRRLHHATRVRLRHCPGRRLPCSYSWALDSSPQTRLTWYAAHGHALQPNARLETLTITGTLLKGLERLQTDARSRRFSAAFTLSVLQRPAFTARAAKTSRPASGQHRFAWSRKNLWTALSRKRGILTFLLLFWQSFLFFSRCARLSEGPPNDHY